MLELAIWEKIGALTLELQWLQEGINPYHNFI